MVESVAVVVEAGFGIEVLRREAVAEEAGASAGPGDEPAEGVVGVPRKGAAVDVKVARDVAVVVVAGNVDNAVDREPQKPADSACALQRAREVFAPVVADRGGRVVCVGDSLLHEIPAVVEERGRGIWRHLLHTAGLRVVEVRDERNAVRRDRLQATGGVVGERQDAVEKHVAVCIVCRLTQSHRVTENGGVLVESVGRVGVRRGVERGLQQIAYAVIRIRVLRILAAWAPLGQRFRSR